MQKILEEKSEIYARLSRGETVLNGSFGRFFEAAIFLGNAKDGK